ncbi:MAG TPA: substrate-binding domain-containing protein, partial [Gemmatimonadaceae bacterium]|nr:substrate-binding domain-containing protein [Gemmatimonadaceae bacterium]
RTGAEAAAAELSKEHGVNVKINWLTPPSENAELQAQRIAQAVNSGANAILVSASDAGKITGAINEAVERGVPVMSFDSDAPDSKRFSFYGGDDHAMGSQVMSELARQMNGKGKIAILSGNQNAPNLQKRVQGVLDEAKKYPGITIVNTFYTIETPQDAAAEVLRAQQAYPEIQGWAMIGGWALFTRALITDLDPSKVKIVSVDALPVELAYVDAGLTPVLLAQPTYLWGYQSVHTIFDHVYLKKEVPAHVQMELVRVSKENLGDWARQLQEWGYPDVDPKYLSLGK